MLLRKIWEEMENAKYHTGIQKGQKKARMGGFSLHPDWDAEGLENCPAETIKGETARHWAEEEM